jgi:glycosyltransferase involved in cell wall biosynthesis
VGGISREVPHEVRGILISPSDPDGLIEAVMRLIKDHDLRRSIIKNNGEYMSKFLENSDAGRQIETLFYKYVKEGIHARD